MSNHNSKSVNVYMTLDQLVINGYFNKHDPTPIYKRQLSHQFEQYIMTSVMSAKRFDPIFYKFKFTNDIDKQYAEPLIYAIRRHFAELKEEKIKDFIRFKRHNWALLAVSIVIVVLCHIMLPVIFNQEHGISAGLSNSLEVFAWVILWHPIDELIFNWNPHLKQICLLNKLATAELILIENEKKIATPNPAGAVDVMRSVA